MMNDIGRINQSVARRDDIDASNFNNHQEKER